MKRDLKTNLMSNILLGSTGDQVSFKRRKRTPRSLLWWVVTIIAMAGLSMLIHSKVKPFF